MVDAFERTASVAEVPEGEIRAFDLPRGRVALANLDGRFYAFEDECTHRGCSLAEDGDLRPADASVECTCHGSVFDLTSGEPTQGPALDAMRLFQVRVAEDWIEVGPAQE